MQPEAFLLYCFVCFLFVWRVAYIHGDGPAYMFIFIFVVIGCFAYPGLPAQQKPLTDDTHERS